MLTSIKITWKVPITQGQLLLEKEQNQFKQGLNFSKETMMVSTQHTKIGPFLLKFNKIEIGIVSVMNK